MKTYEQQITLAELEVELAEAEKQVSGGKILSAKEALDALREKYGV